MKIQDIFVLDEAFGDLEEGKAFYNFREPGVGEYFWNSLISDIESLVIYAGIHKKKFGLYRMFAKRFPYSIYYDMVRNVSYVIAVLPMRRNPARIATQIGKRR